MIRQVTQQGNQDAAEKGSYSRGNNFFTTGFKMLNLNKPGQNFKLRILPPNNDESIFKEPYNGFAVPLPTHFGVGDNGKEMCVCPNRLAPRYRVKCPMCAEFSKGEQTRRSRLTFYYYFNCVLISKHTEKDSVIPRQDKEGTLIVYTVRVPKVQVFDILANYLKIQNRAVTDPFSLEKGCAVTISVSEKKVGDQKFPQYQVQFNEASVGDISKRVCIADIKDLRLIGRYLPTNAAMRNIVDGCSITEAMDRFGKIDTTTGVQIGGVKEVAPTETSKDKDILNDLDADLEIDSSDLPKLESVEPNSEPEVDPETKVDLISVDDVILDNDPAAEDDLPF